MIRNFLLTTFRNLLRHKLQALVNIASLTLGLAVFGFAFLYVKQQLNYDRSWPDAESIHRLVVEVRGMPGMADNDSTSVTALAWPGILERFSGEMTAATRTTSHAITIKDPTELREASLFFVDPAFSDIFALDVIAGDLERVLDGPGFVALEEGLAAALGPDIIPGKRLTLTGQLGDEVDFEVAALFRLPKNLSSPVNFRMLTSTHDYGTALFGAARRQWSWEATSQVWLKLKPGISTEAFNALQPAHIESTVRAYDELLGPQRRVSDHLLFRWQSLPELHFNPIDYEANNAGDPARVASFAIVGILVLLVACSNSISLSLAGAIERRKEVGIRKAAGALRRDLIVQHLGESVLLALLALVPAVTLLEALRPTFATLMPSTATLDASSSGYLTLALIAAVVGLANGVYPALVLSSVRPQAVLKPGAGGGVTAGQAMRGLLVGAQFCFASMLLIATAAFYLQLSLMRAQPLGFNPANLVFVFFGSGLNAQSRDTLDEEAARIPGIAGVVPGFGLPNSYTITGDSVTLISKDAGSGEVSVPLIYVDDEFLDLLEIPLLAGRGYDAARDDIAWSAPEDGAPRPEVPLVINRAATRALGFASPEAAVGQQIHRHALNTRSGEFSEAPVRIIGVAEDNMYGSMRRVPGPEVYVLITQSVPYRILKYDAAIESSLQQEINDLSRRLFDAPPRAIIYFEQEVEDAFGQERIESKLLLICGGLALLLACIGLYGLAAFVIERRTKEVGVRKAMGAEVGALVALFLWRFTRPILLSSFVAWPVAIYFVLQWIERFPYQLEKTWLLPLCLGATLAVLVIALATVSIITARAAMAEPIKALRYE